MKIGKGVEGSPEEIRDFCENFGLNIMEYIERPTKPLNNILLILPISLFFISIITLQFVPESCQFIVFLISCFIILWSAICFAIKYGIGVATFAAIGGLFILLVAYKIIAPNEILNKIDEMKQIANPK